MKQKTDLPWLNRPSIYDHIAKNINPKTGKISKEGQHLPDEERRFAGTEWRWKPGAKDGVAIHGALRPQISSEESPKIAKQVIQHILEIANRNSEKAKIELYPILLKNEVLGYIDEALREILKSNVRSTPELHEFALSLAKTAHDCEPVKFAIALLGIIGDPKDVGVVSFLGLHEEFTFYSVVALSNILKDPENDLWKLAQKVDGWGRIHIVERLASTTSPEIKDWLLREGYQNAVMNEYLAFDCAVGGDLRAALSNSDVDEEILHAATDIIEALIDGGPAKDIQDYKDAAEVILRYLQILEVRASKVDHYRVVDSILFYLTNKWDMDENVYNGWNKENRDQAIVLANQILHKPFWQAIVEKALKSEDDREFYRAVRAAEHLDIDTWILRWNHLKENPLDGSRWVYVMLNNADKGRIDQIIDLAIRVLPLEEIATGPSDKFGFGANYRAHWCLDFIVQNLRLFPGKGWALIAAGLKSPVTSNRNMALKALTKWGKTYWPEEAEQALLEAVQIEPNIEVRDRMKKLLQKGNKEGELH